MFNMENSKDIQRGKFQEFAIWKIRKICYLENYKKFAISKIQKISNVGHFKNFQIYKLSYISSVQII